MKWVASENRFHPVRNYLDSLQWDGAPRLMHLMSRGFGAKGAWQGHASYLASVGRCWLISAVARVYSPGCKVDTMPILEGPQSALKLVRNTGPVPRRGMVLGHRCPPTWRAKDAPAAPGRQLADRDVRDIAPSQERGRQPQVLPFSTQVDKFRPSYGRAEVSRPRQCVFVGTTNEDQYLSDVTGNRRFWPIKVGHVSLEWIRANRDQLWAEAREMLPGR